MALGGRKGLTPETVERRETLFPEYRPAVLGGSVAEGNVDSWSQQAGMPPAAVQCADLPSCNSAHTGQVSPDDLAVPTEGTGSEMWHRNVLILWLLLLVS